MDPYVVNRDSAVLLLQLIFVVHLRLFSLPIDFKDKFYLEYESKSKYTKKNSTKNLTSKLISVIQNHEDYEKVLKAIRERDTADINRNHGPLKKAEDSVTIENDSITLEQTVDKIIEIFEERRDKK